MDHLGRVLSAALLAGTALTGPIMMAPSALAGEDVTETIVDGRPAEAGSWPAIAMFGEQGTPFTKYTFCGGTLIHPRIVLTAAHCVVVKPGEPPATSFKLGLGRLKRSGHGGETIRVIADVVHRDYDRKTLHNDLAMVVLARASQQPTMPLLKQSRRLTVGRSAQVAGWGNLSEGGGQPDRLQEATMSVLPQRRCDEVYDDYDRRTGFCAGHWPGPGPDTCQGDSGGPMTISVNGEARLAGVTSFGGDCGAPKEPGVYTDLTRYKRWIGVNVRRVLGALGRG
ncbi:MAG: serine protease [Actinobacteria bacterium]|nr:serine protease [Actinomycetota bacterium]